MPHVVLLGPQRFRPTVAATLISLGVSGSIAVITAGWQEREEELDELRDHVGREVINLRLYARYEETLNRDPELAAALRRRQDELQHLQDLYRRRLEHGLQAAREMMAREGGGSFLLEHRRAAIRAVRTLDRQHLTRLRRLHVEFDERYRLAERPAVAEQRGWVREEIGRCSALAVAGGHVTILVNRLRLFDPLALVGNRPVIAWSAGAMALAERIVLFHDSPPQGRGNPEVLESGLAAFPNLVPLPHARARLQLDNPVRVALFARRFSPASCVMLEQEARLDWDGSAWHESEGTERLGKNGKLQRMVHR